MSEALTSHNWMKNRIKHTQNIYLLKKKQSEIERSERSMCKIAVQKAIQITWLCLNLLSRASMVKIMRRMHIRCAINTVILTPFGVYECCLAFASYYIYVLSVAWCFHMQSTQKHSVCVCVPVVRSSIFVKWMLFLLFPSFFLILANFYT